MTEPIGLYGSPVYEPEDPLPAFYYAASPAAMDEGDTVAFSVTSTGADILLYELDSGTLPGGCSLDPTTGAILGVADYSSPGGSAVIKGTDANDATAFATFDWTVTPLAPVISYASPQSWGVGIPVSLSPSQVGGPVDTYAIQSGSLPAGVGLDETSGEISGTPTNASSGSVVILATGPGGSDTSSIDWSVAQETRRVQAVGPGGQSSSPFLITVLPAPSTVGSMIGDLSFIPAPDGNLQVQFTAPDAGTNEAYDSYEYAVREYHFTPANINTAVPIDAGTVPRAPGSLDGFTITGLEKGNVFQTIVRGVKNGIPGPWSMNSHGVAGATTGSPLDDEVIPPDAIQVTQAWIDANCPYTVPAGGAYLVLQEDVVAPPTGKAIILPPWSDTPFTFHTNGFTATYRSNGSGGLRLLAGTEKDRTVSMLGSGDILTQSVGEAFIPDDYYRFVYFSGQTGFVDGYYHILEVIDANTVRLDRNATTGSDAQGGQVQSGAADYAYASGDTNEPFIYGDGNWGHIRILGTGSIVQAPDATGVWPHGDPATGVPAWADALKLKQHDGKVEIIGANITTDSMDSVAVAVENSGADNYIVHNTFSGLYEGSGMYRDGSPQHPVKYLFSNSGGGASLRMHHNHVPKSPAGAYRLTKSGVEPLVSFHHNTCDGVRAYNGNNYMFAGGASALSAMFDNKLVGEAPGMHAGSPWPVHDNELDCRVRPVQDWARGTVYNWCHGIKMEAAGAASVFYHNRVSVFGDGVTFWEPLVIDVTFSIAAARFYENLLIATQENDSNGCILHWLEGEDADNAFSFNAARTSKEFVRFGSSSDWYRLNLGTFYVEQNAAGNTYAKWCDWQVNGLLPPPNGFKDALTALDTSLLSKYSGGDFFDDRKFTFTVRVLDGGVPVVGETVEVFDKNDTPQFTGVTDANGIVCCEDLMVTRYVGAPGSTTFNSTDYGPFKITVGGASDTLDADSITACDFEKTTGLVTKSVTAPPAPSDVKVRKLSPTKVFFDFDTPDAPHGVFAYLVRDGGETIGYFPASSGAYAFGLDPATTYTGIEIFTVGANGLESATGASVSFTTGAEQRGNL